MSKLKCNLTTTSNIRWEFEKIFGLHFGPIITFLHHLGFVLRCSSCAQNWMWNNNKTQHAHTGLWNKNFVRKWIAKKCRHTNVSWIFRVLYQLLAEHLKLTLYLIKIHFFVNWIFDLQNDLDNVFLRIHCLMRVIHSHVIRFFYTGNNIYRPHFI